MKTQLKNLINEMITYYRENDSFEPWQLNEILNLSEHQENEISELINKFYNIVTTVTSNGGIPVLKTILTKLNEQTEIINSQLKIVKLNDQKFPTVDGYYKPTGYAFKHPELGYFAFEGYDYPYTPAGGRKALKSILEAGGFLNFDDSKWLQPMN